MGDKAGGSGAPNCNYSITYCGYAFTVGEMHAEIRARREEARRVRKLGEAALDLNKLLATDFARVVAIRDYYDLVWMPTQAGLAGLAGLSGLAGLAGLAGQKR